MKSMRKPLIVLAAFAVAIEIFAGCATTRVKPVQKTEVLDDKGAAFGIQTPEWVTAYLASGGNTGVEKLSAYKDKYCFVVEQNDASRDFAVAWVQNASGPKAIAEKVSTTVAASASRSLSGEKGGNIAEYKKHFKGKMYGAKDWERIQKEGPKTAREYRAWLYGNPSAFGDMSAHVLSGISNALTVLGGGEASDTWMGKHNKAYAEYKTKNLEAQERGKIESEKIYRDLINDKAKSSEDNIR